MPAALAREGLALPAAPALAQAHAGELGHQVEFRRPRVSKRNRQALGPAVDDLEVMGREALNGDVVLVEAPAGVADVEGADGLPGRKPPELGDSHLDEEAAAGLEVRRHVAKARDLRRLRRQIRDRVEDEMCEREGPVDGRCREVPDRDADVLAARLCS